MDAVEGGTRSHMRMLRASAGVRGSGSPTGGPAACNLRTIRVLKVGRVPNYPWIDLNQYYCCLFVWDLPAGSVLDLGLPCACLEPCRVQGRTPGLGHALLLCCCPSNPGYLSWDQRVISVRTQNVLWFRTTRKLS